MKKHLSLLAGILLMLAANTLSAQDKAVELFNNITKSVKSHQDIEVSFNYLKVESPGKPTEESKGKAYFQGEAYKLLLDEMHTLSDGTTKWLYLPEENEVMIGTIDEGDQDPMKLLTGLEKEGTPKAQGTDAKGNILVALYESSGEPMGITLKFNKKGEIAGLEMDLGDDGSMTLDITEIKYDQGFPKGFFTFDKTAYPGVEIIDMR